MQPNAYLHQLTIRPLPAWIAALFEQQHAPPRLTAHALLVADVAAHLVTALHHIVPTHPVDDTAVIAGAALHDIGKVLYPEEIIGPGQRHEQAGYALLVHHDVPLALARFTQTHGRWRDQADLSLEDLLVALADSCWKGKREEALEQRIAAQLGAEGDRWQIWLALDECIEQIAADAPKRLAWQQQFSPYTNATQP